MAKVNKLRRKPGPKESRALQTVFTSKFLKQVHPKRKLNDSAENKKKKKKKKEWEDSTCSVCMESPHNAVLLLCSSYDKGCRPYMCATSHRFSNCLDQYKKAYTKMASTSELWSDLSPTDGVGKSRVVAELLCPLCRGQVKGWTVVDSARKYLNLKKRSCMQEACKFVGSYKELRKHVKANHPLARPREVDPASEEKWRRLERERERSDVISTIVSSTPGAVVLGDYVLEPMHGGFFNDSDYDSDVDGLGEFDFGSVSLGRSSGGIFGEGFRNSRPTVAGFLDIAQRRNLYRRMVARRRWNMGGVRTHN